MQKFKPLAVSMVLSTLLLLTGCSEQQAGSAVVQPELARPAKIVPVASAGLSMLRTYPGSLVAAEHADLAFRVGGELVELPAQAGLQVKKGDLLAQLDETSFRNTFNEREARFELAQIQFEQANKLRKKNLSTQLQFDQASAELKSAQAALDQAGDDLGYTRLLAPFDGIVARVDVENHQAIKAQVPVIELQDSERLDIHFSVPESLISQMKRVDDPRIIEQVCGVTRFASRHGKVYRACHKEHETVPDPVTRNYAVIFTLDPITDFAALPGMTATIEIDFSGFLPDDAADSLLVPVEAVFEQQGRQWVWGLDKERRAHKRPIEVGRLEGVMLEIVEGLSKDDFVVAAGVAHVREGMLLKPLVKERGL